MPSTAPFPGGGAVDLTAQRDSLLAHGLGVNVAPLVPHGAIRDSVMGMADRIPTDAEMQAMRRLVRTGMRAGGFGLSSGPFYAPGSYAETDEFIALSAVAASGPSARASRIPETTTPFRGSWTRTCRSGRSWTSEPPSVA